MADTLVQLMDFLAAIDQPTLLLMITMLMVLVSLMETHLTELTYGHLVLVQVIVP